VAETQLVPKNTALIVQRVPATRSQPILAPPPVAVTSTVSTTDALYGSTPTALGDANAPINEQQRIQNLLADAASTYKPSVVNCKHININVYLFIYLFIIYEYGSFFVFYMKKKKKNLNNPLIVVIVLFMIPMM